MSKMGDFAIDVCNLADALIADGVDPQAAYAYAADLLLRQRKNQAE